MVTERIGKNKVVRYSGETKEFPVGRYMDFKRYVLQDAGIGSTLQDFDNHWMQIDRLYKKGETDKVATAIENLRASYHFVLEGINPELMSFVTLLKTWNGQSVDASTDDKVKEWAERIKNDISMGTMQSILESFKKKMSLRWKTIFQKSLKAPKT